VTESACGLSIGGHALPNRAFLAPMAGITDASMRRLAESHGAGLVVSEMIASNALATGHRDMVRKLSKSGLLPHMVQLAGCEAEWLVQGARIAAEAGADIIDINMGCPAKRVTNGYAGSALMRVPDEALRLIEAVVGATPLPVTVKMRLGWDDDSLNAPQIARNAVNAGVRMITVHGRTRQQFYKGTARWNLVRSVVDAVAVPVVVNGDITNLAAAREALDQSGAAAVMIGRGAQGQPWLVGQVGAGLQGRESVPTPTGPALVDHVIGHYESILTEYGVSIGVRVARKHLDWYLQAAGCAVDAPTRKSLLSQEDPKAVIDILPRMLGAWRQAA